MAAEKTKPIYPQVLELPPGLSDQEFRTLVADRIRDLNQLIKGLGLNPSVADLSLGSFRMTNVGDPTDDLDGVNLRTLRRMSAQPAASPAATVAAPAAVATNSAASGGAVVLGPSGVPTTGTALPSNTPVVSALPTSGLLAVVNQYVIFNGQPYIYTAGVSGGANYWALDVTGVPSIRDVWANLVLYPAANYPVGTVFLATDRSVSYAVQATSPGAKNWIYYNGICEDLLANRPMDLDDRSRGLYFRASDYLHNWMWTGSAYSLRAAAQTGFAGGLLPGSMLFANPGPPFSGSGALWQLCDGSTVDVSQEDASVIATTVPTIANTWFVR